MDFMKALHNEMNMTQTENGANAVKTTNSNLLDFFSRGGAMRERTEDDIFRTFNRAFSEDALNAMKALFYFRDIRGGQGERRLFRVILERLAGTNPSAVSKNIHLIPKYGRWDDIFVLFGTPCEGDALRLIRTQLREDTVVEKPSLLAKWMKSENASSEESKRIAKVVRKYLGMDSKQYRKMLSSLRKKIDLVETKMSNNEFAAIDYSKLPSKASMQYRKAFNTKDGIRYGQYLESLKKGETKVNSKTLFPYEIVEKILDSRSMFGRGLSYEEITLLNGMWDALPNYIDQPEESLCMVDVSGSMSGRPMAVAISMGLYMSERNHGPYKDVFMTFSTAPELVSVTGDTLADKVLNMSRANWKMTTNLSRAMMTILKVAVQEHLSEDDMPKTLYIISDMEFDRAMDQRIDEVFIDSIKRKFNEHGYEMPRIVFWNVNARNDHSPITTDHRGIQLVSGASPSIFKNLLNKKDMTAVDMMMDILGSERYEEVTV